MAISPRTRRRLEGRTAVISGGARGQGEAEARLFVDEGARVVIADVLDELGGALAAELGPNAAYIHLDVRDEAQWEAAVKEAEERFGPVSVLVNNAGIFRVIPLLDTSVETFLDVMAVNALGCFLGMKAVVPSMRRAGGGSIVNVSSTAGMAGFSGTVAYSGSKFAVRGMTKTVALELGPEGIRVNSIHPGGVDTEMIRPFRVEQSGDETQPATLYQTLPLRRISQPIEIARLALFLASDESSYCTGAEFIADGGLLAQ